MNLEGLAPLLLVLPLAGFLLTALIGRRLHKQAHWIPVLAIGVVWLIAMGLVVNVLTGVAPGLEGSEETHGYAIDLFRWIPAGEFVVDVGILIDQSDDFVRGVAFADDAVGHGMGDLLDQRRESIEHQIGLFMRLGLHDVGDAKPLLITLGGLQHAQHHDLRLGARGARRRPEHGAVALLGVVDDNQVFALVTSFVAAALVRHRRPSRRPLDEPDAQASNGGMAG